MSRLIRAVIDTGALRANLRALRGFAPQARVVAVVKANAYGHGLVHTALALPEADAFGVARLEEGILLRDAGIKQPIVLLKAHHDLLDHGRGKQRPHPLEAVAGLQFDEDHVAPREQLGVRPEHRVHGAGAHASIN